MSEGNGIPWPVWAGITILVALIGAGATIMATRPGPTPGPAPAPGPTSAPQLPSPGPASGLAGAYLMDNQTSRRVVLTHLQGPQYRAEEPSGSWPWEGTPTLNGTTVIGQARFTTSQARMNLKGQLRGDDSIQIDYEFLVRGDGSPGAGRVDHHVWFPAR